MAAIFSEGLALVKAVIREIYGKREGVIPGGPEVLSLFEAVVHVFFTQH